MDTQRPLLYLTLIFLGFMLWSAWQTQHAPKPVPAPNGVTSTATNTTTASAAGEVPNTALNTANNTVATNSQAQVITIKTDVLHLKISTQGGDIIEAGLPTYPISLEQKDQPTQILDQNGRNYVAQSGLLHTTIAGQNTEGLAPNHQALYSAAQTAYTLADGQNELVVPLTWTGANGVQVTKRYVLKRGDFNLQVQHEVQNNSNQLWSGSEYRQIKHGPAIAAGSMLGGIQAYNGGAYYYQDKYTKIAFANMESEPIDLKTTGGWVAVLQHYFVSAWIPNQTEQTSYSSRGVTQLGNKAYILGATGPVHQVAPGAKDTFSSQFYVGPKDQDNLEKLAKGLDLTVDYGVFAFVSKPIFWLMQHIHSAVGNWGWTIILLTLFIKILFFYPSAASYKSMAKMKAFAPRMKEINERHANDPQAKQKAMMELYRKEKINPLGGCLPILIQIPVFMGLYWVLVESVELRQAPWIFWYKDLSVMDPFFILPLLMGISMFVQQKLNPPPTDPMQQKIFQFMPIIFTVLFLFFPAGLVLYWVVNNVLSIAQQWFINNKIIGHA
ncbi:membrane protein insertase YidC [Thiofilum flexile]|uniref:membrane protein insertase YidC n=1 Tax=Thiofilum flexile TaxID=125627 RepID=UPI0003733038|nr:membrane protein insertase YidC [Thiofilum flexile]